MDSTQRVRDFGTISPNELSSSSATPRGSGNNMYEKAEGLEEPEGMDDTTGLTHILTHRLWQHTPGLHRSKTNRVPALRGKCTQAPILTN